MKHDTSKTPVIPVLLLSFCLAFSLVISSYDEMSEVDIFSPYVSFESQDRSGWNTNEKVKGAPLISFSATYLLAVVFLIQRALFVFPASPDEKLSRRLRC